MKEADREGDEERDERIDELVSLAPPSVTSPLQSTPCPRCRTRAVNLSRKGRDIKGTGVSLLRYNDAEDE